MTSPKWQRVLGTARPSCGYDAATSLTANFSGVSNNLGRSCVNCFPTERAWWNCVDGYAKHLEAPIALFNFYSAFAGSVTFCPYRDIVEIAIFAEPSIGLRLNDT